MVRIGILTYHRSLNYGAVMQAVALSSEIKRRFPDTEVEIIDYMSKRMDRYYKLITLYRGKESAFHLKARLQMYLAFQRGLKKLPLSKKRLVTDNYDVFCKKLEKQYDIVISGSDAVWNFSKRGIPNPYFLTHSQDSYRFSYAASCNGLGLSNFDELKTDERQYLKEAFEKFEYIGVRDCQTEELVRTVCPNAKIHHNCDPSLLFSDLSNVERINLIQKLKKKYNFDPEKPTIAFMMSNLNGDFRKQLAERIKEKYGDFYQTVSLYSYNKYADIPYIADLTPQEWSIVFGLFDLTISKYFHGTMFSLLNRTPVIAVGAEKSIGSLPNKISDALGRMNLLKYYFAADKSSTVDWDELMDRIDECLKMKPIKQMEQGIVQELKSADSFFETLEQTIAKVYDGK